MTARPTPLNVLRADLAYHWAARANHGENWGDLVGLLRSIAHRPAPPLSDDQIAEIQDVAASYLSGRAGADVADGTLAVAIRRLRAVGIDPWGGWGERM